MTLGLWPEAVPFDPDSGTAVHELREHFDAARLPAAVLLVCARNLRGTAWPKAAAIGLARALTETGSVVLADLDFEEPGLHETLGEANGEGVADAVLFGASLDRVTVRPAGESFDFVPAGAYAPDPVELMGHAAWQRLLADIGARRKLLLGYAPLGSAGLDGLAERIPAVIVLADDDAVAQTVALLPHTIRVEGVIRPAHAVAEEESEPGAADQEPGSDAAVASEPSFDPTSMVPSRATREDARRALQADLEARQRAADAMGLMRKATPAVEPASVTAETAAPVAPSSESVTASPRSKRPINVRRVGAAAALVATIAAVSWLGGRLLAGRSESEIASRAAESSGAPAVAAGDLLGYSVAIEAYDRLELALARVDSLSAAEPGLAFFVAPVRIDDDVFYRVLAGPMTDSTTASAVLGALVDRGLKIAASEFDVRSTPLAFLVGDYEFRGDAQMRMTELKAQDVPTYIIEVPYTKGPARFHLYAGAFSGPTEAAVMRETLRQAGIQDTLVLRVGRKLP